MSYSIYITEFFEKEIKKLSKKYPSIKNDYLNLIKSLQENPIQGVALGKDCYKVRMAIASKNKGKSAGSRVITCVKIEAKNIYLLSIWDKSHKSNISEKDLNELLKLSGIG